MYGGGLRCRSPYGSAPYHLFSRQSCPPGQLTLQMKGKTYNFTYNSGPSPYFNYYLHTYSVIGKTSLSFGSRLLTSCPGINPLNLPIVDCLLLTFTHRSENIISQYNNLIFLLFVFAELGYLHSVNAYSQIFLTSLQTPLLVFPRFDMSTTSLP